MPSEVDRNGNTITVTYPTTGDQTSIAGKAGSAPVTPSTSPRRSRRHGVGHL
jgi:hypothetical protein